MDWLDQYLDGLGEYKTTVSPADTHIWGVKPKLNNVQERMIFDAAAQSEAEFRQLVQEARAELEEHGMSRDDVAEGIGADPGSNIFSSILSFQVNTNNQTIPLPGNASVFEFTVGNAVSSFNLNLVGFGSFSILNNYDENSFSNCYLSAYNLNNITISYNPVYVTASESLCSNGQLFTIYYSNTGSAIFSITKSDTLEPAPSPTPTRTPGVTVTPSITPTITPTPSITPNEGFAVSSTNQVVLANTGGYDGVYTKSEYDPTIWDYQYGNFTKFAAPNYSSNTTGVWVLWNADESEPIYEVISGSSNINYIPTIGWTPAGMTVSLPPTPTPTRTPTPTITPTRTPTPTTSITPTRTPTPTITPTVSITPSTSLTPTRTPTPTITPTVSITPSTSLTPTRTPTPTVTPSSTPPAAFSALLKEDGDGLLQENNDYILLEQQ